MPRGGRRPGAGRPPGSADANPRSSKRIKDINEIAEAYQAGEFLITNKDKNFTGSALQLIKAVYAAEALPIKLRLYAATKAAEYENQVGKDGQPLGINTEVHVYLPSNSRDVELEAKLGSISLEEREAHERHRGEEVERKDKQLRSWILAGLMTEEGALAARSQWAMPGDAAWVPQRRQIEFHPQQIDIPICESTTPSNGSNEVISEEACKIQVPFGSPELDILAKQQLSDAIIDQSPTRVILFAEPWRVINLNTSRGPVQYQANQRGEIEADPDDVAALLMFGWRRSP